MMDVTQVALSTTTLAEGNPPGASMWQGSKFESFYLMSSPKAKGCRGERLAADILENLGHNVPRNRKGRPVRIKGDSDHDIVVNGHRIEVKMSLTWGGVENCFTWQQIRPSQGYDRIVFIGINPNSVQMWWATKADITKHIEGCDSYRQHGGKDGKQDLYWIRNEVPTWFRSLKEW